MQFFLPYKSYKKKKFNSDNLILSIIIDLGILPF